MPSLLEDTLELISSFEHTPAQRREVIRSFLPELIEDNYSRTRAHKLFRDYGLGINDKVFRDLYNETRFNKYIDSSIIYLPKDEKIDERFMNISSSNFKGRYLYVVQYSVVDPDAESIERREWGLSTSEKLSKDEVMNRILDRMEQNDSVPMDYVTAMNVRKVFVNPDL